MEKMFHSASICLKLFIPALELLHLVSIHVSSGSESWLAQGVANTNNKLGGWEVLPTALNSLIVVSVSPCHKMEKKNSNRRRYSAFPSCLGLDVIIQTYI